MSCRPLRHDAVSGPPARSAAHLAAYPGSVRLRGPQLRALTRRSRLRVNPAFHSSLPFSPTPCNDAIGCEASRYAAAAQCNLAMS